MKIMSLQHSKIYIVSICLKIVEVVFAWKEIDIMSIAILYAYISVAKASFWEGSHCFRIIARNDVAR